MESTWLEVWRVMVSLAPALILPVLLDVRRRISSEQRAIESMACRYSRSRSATARVVGSQSRVLFAIRIARYSLRLEVGQNGRTQ